MADYKLTSLLRKYQQSKDAASAIEFAEAFARTVHDPKAHANEFYNSWWWLHYHPAFFLKGRLNGHPGFWRSLELSTHKVSLKSKRIEDAKEENNYVRIWLEAGPWTDPQEHIATTNNHILIEEWYTTGVCSHDYRLDCGGDTYEEAIIEMARLVKKYYGDYKTKDVAGNVNIPVDDINDDFSPADIVVDEDE